MTIDYVRVAKSLITEFESLNTPNVFNIGCLERFDVAINMQQERALSLIWALKKLRRITSSTTIGVIGAGPAGASAGVLGALYGAQQVDLFDVASRPFATLQDAKHRWIHPAYFSEYMLHYSEFYDWSDTTIFSWKSGWAADVAKVLEDKLNLYLEKCPNLEFLPRHYITGVGRNLGYSENGPPTLHYTVREGDHISAANSCYDLTIIATGFGSDASGNPKSRVGTKDYWKSGSRRSYAVLTQNRRKPRVLISGTGDGGAVEIFN